MIIKTESEARDWFLSHSSGSVFVEDKDGNYKECFSYIKAIEFLTGSPP